MKRVIIAAALLILTVSAAPAAPAKKWFLTVHGYWTSNRGNIQWDQPTTAHLKRAFDTRGDCLARWRTFRKECGGLVTDNIPGGYSLHKLTGFCRRHLQQPEPVFNAPTTNSLDPEIVRGFEQERKCAE